MIKALIMCCMLFGALTPGASLAAEPAPAALQPSEAFEGRLTIPVRINGQGPFRFLIDTGADQTVISSDLAERLALPKGKRVRLHALGGVQEVRTARIERLELAGKVFTQINAPALSARNLGADGVIGIDSLKDLRLVIDFTANTMQVSPSSKASARDKPERGEIIVSARYRLGQLVMVDADADNQKIWVVVDTGGQSSVGNKRLQALLARRVSTLEADGIEMLDVIGNRTVADYAIVHRLRIGGMLMHEPGIAFADAHPFKEFGLTDKPSLLLGMDGLRSFRRVSIDFPSRTIRFLLPADG
jgi:predicted aspartyl protease